VIGRCERQPDDFLVSAFVPTLLTMYKLNKDRWFSGHPLRLWVVSSVVLVTFTSSVSAAATPRKEALKPAAVQLSDLGEGWSIDSDTTSSDSSRGLCGSAVFVDSNALGSFETQFTRGTFGPVVRSQVAQLKKGTAKKAVNELVKLLDRCKTDSETKADGTTQIIRIAKMNTPKLADQSAGNRITIDGEIPVGGEFVVVRKGDVVSTVVVAGLIVDPPAISLAKKIAARINKVK
jgi:hypothetical protein